MRPCSRTIMVALDLKRAFDTVSHNLLMQDIMNTCIPSQFKHWLISYLRGRNTYVEYHDKTSGHRKMKQAVPQGGVLSPTLFNLYLSKIPIPPSNVSLVSCADDCTILTSGNDLPAMCNRLNSYLGELSNWFRHRNLHLS